MQKLTLTISLLALILCTASASVADLLGYDIDSQILDENRRLRVQVPPDYAGSGISYPLVVVLDGSSLDLPPTNGHPRLPHILAELVATGEVPPVILMGILNTDRTRDMTPTKLDMRNSSGGGDAFLDFIADELIPWAESEFRCDGRRVLYGHSLAGLLATHALLTRPTLFDGVIAASPALSWDEDLLLKMAPELLTGLVSEPRAFYFAIGARDSYRQFIRTNRSLDDLLEAQAPSRLAYRFEVLPQEDHMSVVPVVFRAGLAYVFAQEALHAPSNLTPTPTRASP
jgi:predicted alpha/beta superfamily hydrolase